MSDEPMIDAGEVARRLGMSRNGVTKLARAGRIPCVKIAPRVIRFDWACVLAALQVRNDGAAKIKSGVE